MSNNLPVLLREALQAGIPDPKPKKKYDLIERTAVTGPTKF